jgi:hypothetical protein
VTLGAGASIFGLRSSILGEEKKMRYLVLTRWLSVMVLLALCGCGKSTSPVEAANPSEVNSTTLGGTEKQIDKRDPTLKPMVVDAGTVIIVTMDQSISSKTNNPGDYFDASVAAPVMAHGKQVIPLGARASGTVTDAKSAGRFKGGAELGVTLDSVTVNNKTYQIQTTAVEESGKGRGKRTAEGAGGGAAVGAIIGAIAGGGKGAAIGAGAGAGAGTAGAAFTGNRDIAISAETKLSFKLTEPLEIRKK